jgi:hypothetical protein
MRASSDRFLAVRPLVLQLLYGSNPIPTTHQEILSTGQLALAHYLMIYLYGKSTFSFVPTQGVESLVSRGLLVNGTTVAFNPGCLTFEVLEQLYL